MLVADGQGFRFGAQERRARNARSGLRQIHEVHARMRRVRTSNQRFTAPSPSGEQSHPGPPGFNCLFFELQAGNGLRNVVSLGAMRTELVRSTS